MSSFDAFFRENYSLVVATAQRRVDSIEDAEEIAAAAFRVAWQRHSAGEELSVPWLYGVVRNLVGNEYRRRGRQTALTERLASQAEIDGAHDDRIQDDGDIELLRDAMASLPKKHREVLEMTYWDDLSGAEVAEYLGLSVGAVHVRLTRARDSLRKVLEKRGGGA